MGLVKSGELLESPNVKNAEITMRKTRAISSQAVMGNGITEGSTTRKVSPNNNLFHERPTHRKQWV